MVRFVSPISLMCVLGACLGITSCSSSSPTHVTPNEVPASVVLSPASNVSLELGNTQTFTASATNSVGNAVTETFTFLSSNPSVLTVASNGNACAGTWDSLSAPTLCTPGGTGLAQVTAEANGVISPPVTVYVHQHVTKVVIQKLANQPPTLSTQCLSKGAPTGPEQLIYQAFAFSGDTDITPSVGSFTWGTATVPGNTGNASVTLSPPASLVPLNQQVATASQPGSASIFASVGGVNSQPLTFTTCPVQSISLTVAGSPPAQTSFALSQGGSVTINATAKDILGMPLIGVPLTWSSSNAPSVAVVGATSNVYSSIGTVSPAGIGAGAVIASCTPPTCNGGIAPSMAIYPDNALTFSVKASSTTTGTSATVYATSTACNGTTQFCTTRLIPITRSSSSSSFAAGAPVTLPFAPNSFSFAQLPGGAGYLGVQNASFGTQGAMVLSGTSVSQLNGAAGKVLAVSPDGGTVILSDTLDSPSRVNICKSCNNGGRSLVSVLLPNPVAAAFSPEGGVGLNSGYKAYIVSASSCPGAASAGCLLVYSQVDAPQFVPLPAPATDAAFIGIGSAGYIAEGTQSVYLPTCGPSTAGLLGSAGIAAQLLRPLPDGMSLLALNPPGLQTVTASVSGSGCPSPRGSLTISNTPGPTFNLGIGNFTPTQFFVSPDGTKAYLVAQTVSGTSTAPLPFITVFDLAAQTTALISLAGNATPLSATLTPAGDLLFVGASDGTVHVIDTTTRIDTQQVSFTFPDTSLCIGPGSPATQAPVTCNPDLIAAVP